MPRLLATALLLVACSCVNAADNWPQFRGPGAAGVALGKGYSDTWTTTKNVAWKTDIPGRGWSSPIIWGERVFLTSVVREGTYEEAKKGLYFGGERLTPSKDVHHWMIYCLDWSTGKTLWEK